MKINHQKPHLKQSQEARRENSHTGVTQGTLPVPMEKKYLDSSTGSDTYLGPQQEEEKIPLCPIIAQSMGSCHNSANEKSLYFELLISSSLFTTASAKSTEQYSSPLFLWI